MKRTYVGVTPRHLASGRPLVFGDVVDASDLTQEDELILEFLSEPSAAPETEAPEPATSNTEES